MSEIDFSAACIVKDRSVVVTDDYVYVYNNETKKLYSARTTTCIQTTFFNPEKMTAFFKQYPTNAIHQQVCAITASDQRIEFHFAIFGKTIQYSLKPNEKILI